ETIQDRVNKQSASAEPTLADVQLMIARQYGFESWSDLATGLSQPPEDAGDSRLGLSSTPPFYRIDTLRRTIEPRPPLSEGDWDTIFAIMRERNLTGITTPAITDSAMARLARLDFVTRVGFDGA